MTTSVRTLDGILRHSEEAFYARKAELSPGDQVVVATENSVYSIVAGEDSTYSVRGGWFDRHGPTPARVSIHGCTWGGSVIQTNVLAGRGLRLEFANGVVTSPIRDFLVIRAEATPLDMARARVEHEDAKLLAACGISWESEPAVC